MAKKTLGLFLYILLAWCAVQGWVQRQARLNPGLESLFETLLTATPAHTKISVKTPKLSIELSNNDFVSQWQIGEREHEFIGSGSFAPDNLDINFTTSGDLAPLLKQFHPQSLFLAGNYHLAAHVSGTWEHPIFETTIQVKDGNLDSLSTGSRLENAKLEISSNGRTLLITRISGTDGQGGVLTGKGYVDLFDPFLYELEIEIKNFSLIKLDHVGGIFSGKLNLTGDQQETFLKGSIEADSVAFALDESKPAPKTIDIIYINADNKPQQPKTKTLWPLKFDIEITGKQNIWITDQNLNSEWKSNLKLQGTAQAPLVFGSLEMINGSYVINGKPVVIKEGSILFDGDPLRNATLSVIGSLEANTIIAEVVVSGPLANPNLSLRSNPPLAQADILSHLVFGRGLADITPQQSKKLKKSIKELMATSTGTDVLDGIRSRFGIDRIEVNRGKGNELEDVSLQIGKYLVKGLYVAFDKGITSTANRIILEAALRPNLKLQAEISDTAEGQLHLKWRHDY